MITAEAAHVCTMRARDGEDSIVGQFLSKLDAKIQERSRQGMFWMYVDCTKDDIFSNSSLAEIELVKMKLKQLGYAVVEYTSCTWGIAW